MSTDSRDRAQDYVARIHDYINDNPHLFASESSGGESRERGAADPRLTQEILIFPARPWWNFLRPGQIEPPSNLPKPPGWSREWQWRYPDRPGPADRRWFDPKGGEFRWHRPDKHHPDGHWDYNPWHRWNNQWRNVMPPREGPFGAPPVAPSQAGPWIWA